MKKRNSMPTAHTCGTIIHGLCCHGAIEDTSIVFNKVMDTKGVQPDVFCCNSAIIGLCKDKKYMEEAKDDLVEMIQMVIKLNVYAYGALIHGYCNSWEMQVTVLAKSFCLC